MSNSIQWLCIDKSRQCYGDRPSEWKFCENGHSNFISSYRGFTQGKKEILYCSTCGIEIFRFAPFLVTYQELEVDEKGKIIIPNSGESIKV